MKDFNTACKSMQLTGKVQQNRMFMMTTPQPTVMWLMRASGNGHWNVGGTGMPATSKAVNIDRLSRQQLMSPCGIQFVNCRCMVASGSGAT